VGVVRDVKARERARPGDRDDYTLSRQAPKPAGLDASMVRTWQAPEAATNTNAPQLRISTAS